MRQFQMLDKKSPSLMKGFDTLVSKIIEVRIDLLCISRDIVLGLRLVAGR